MTDERVILKQVVMLAVTPEIIAAQAEIR